MENVIKLNTIEKMIFKHPSITINKEIDNINIYPGETITLWLNMDGKLHPIKHVFQMEIRIKDNGEPEIFVHLNQLQKQIKDFDEWYSI